MEQTGSVARSGVRRAETLDYTIQTGDTYLDICETCNIQCVPLATEPGISLIILKTMKILQRNSNRSRFNPGRTQMVATSTTCHDAVTFLTQ